MKPIPPDSKARAYLVARGIDIEAAASGWLSWSNDHAEMFMRLGINGDDESWHSGTIFCDEHKGGRHKRRRRKLRLLELLSFPVHGVANAWMNKAFLDVDSADVSGKGFRVTRGTRKPIFIPPETWDARKDATTSVFLVEGPVKALALQQAGLMAIGLNGTWTSEAVPDKEKLGLKGYQRQKQLLAALREFNWFGRAVYLVFDSDQSVNKGVRHSIVRSFILLHVAGADVRQLTTWDLQEAKGIDDLLIVRGGREKAAETLKALREKALPLVETLDRHDIPMAKKELHRVRMDHAQFDALAKELAKRLGVTKEGLGRFRHDNKPEEEKASAVVEIEPWPEPVSLHEAFSGAVTVFRTYMFMTEAQIAAVVLWCATTFLYDLLQIHAYLGITAPTKQCGKTTLINLVALFVRQGLIVAGRVSAAFIYRAIDRLRPTFIVDEAQAIFRKGPDVEDIYNAGHIKSTANVGLVDKTENGELVERLFNVFCPKVIGLKGKIRDDSLQDRVIEIRLSRIHESDLKEDFWDVFGKSRAFH